MKFDLKEPCKECPFLRGSTTNKTLVKGRLEEIVDAIRDDAHFTCHKTLNKPLKERQHCGGALIFLEKENNPNQFMNVARYLGIYDPSKLNRNSNIIE